MHAFAAAGAAFLIAVLWFDLMFDVQARRARSGPLPPDALDSISAYYRRVTTQASPMGRLVSVVMLATLIAIVAEIATGAAQPWIAWSSLALALAAMGLALTRTVPAAVRLGAAQDDDDTCSRLARRVLAEHLFCLAAMIAVAALQLSAGG
jgi:hypothetical protein